MPYMKAATLLIVLLLGTAASFGAPLQLTPLQLIKTTTTISSSLNPSVYGEAVTFTAVVTPMPPDGETVTFEQGQNILGTGTLAGGSANFTTSTLNGGTESIKAVYGGDSTFNGSTSKPVSQVVQPAPTTTSLVSSLNPSKSGQSVTFTATVSPEYSGTVTGNVSFYNGSTKLAGETLAGGVASYSTTKLPVGTDSIIALYKGNNSFATSSSNIVNQVVNAGSSGCGIGTFIDSSMVWNNITRYYEVYLPSNLPPTPPMVLMLHGTQTTLTTGDDPEPVISLNWGWQPVADQNCFILVKPASTYDPTSHQWDWNAYCMDGSAICAPYGLNGGAFSYAEGCDSLDSECPDDIGFLEQLIINLEGQYNVNPAMVYVAGFSSGAEMTERVGVELSGLVAAIVPASGQLVAEQGTVQPPLPSPPVPPAYPIAVQEWHGTLDENLWPCGYGQTKYNGVTFTLDTVDDTFNYWSSTAANSCTTFQTTQTLCLNGVPNNSNDAPTPGLSGLTGNLASGCTNNVQVQFIWEPGIAHSWQQGYDTERWQFFAANPCPTCGPGEQARREEELRRKTEASR